MAKISNACPKNSSGGYERLIGNKDMANIFTKTQSTVISNGTELERIICEKSNLITNLEEFINQCEENNKENGSYLCPKKILKKSTYNLGHEPDFIIFTIKNNKKSCLIVELKDGDTFDTKKSLAEKEMLQDCLNNLSCEIPFRAEFKICSFNQTKKENIVNGFKNVFKINEVLTGKELCEILQINYSDILKLRQIDTTDNFKYIINEMFKIEDVRKELLTSNNIKLLINEMINTENIRIQLIEELKNNNYIN